MSRFAMLAGRSLRDVTILLAQSTLLILVAIPFGLEIDPVGAVLTLGIVALVGLTFSSLSYTLALVTKSEDAFAPIAQAVTLPLLLLSGIMLPMALAPDWLQTLSSAQPADPRGRCGPGAVQRAVGRPADRHRDGRDGNAGRRSRWCSRRAPSLGPTPDAIDHCAGRVRRPGSRRGPGRST